MSKAQKITGSAKREEDGANLSSIIYHLSAVFVFALFARTLAFSFIGLDDAAYTFRNPFVAGGLSVPNVVEAFTNLRHGGIWMPVTYISYMLDASICRWIGLPLMGEMHFMNVLLHLVNFMLLGKLIGMLFGASALEGTRWADRTPGTDGTNKTADNRKSAGSDLLTTNHYPLTTLIALAAMIWAVHPLRAEPIAWIAARKELLWTLFTLCGLIFWIRGLRSAGCDNRQPTTDSRNDKRQSTCRKVGCRTDRRSPNVECRQSSTPNSQLSTLNSQLLTLIFCALACLSKPTAMCFPFLLLLVTWWLRKEGQVGEWVSEEARDAGGDTRQGTVIPCAKTQPQNNSLRTLRLCVSAVKTNHSPSPLTPQLSNHNCHLSSVICHLSVVFLIAAATAAIAAYSQTHVAGQDAVSLYAAPISHRLVNALSSLGYYLRATFWPFGLHVDFRTVPGLWPLDAGWNFAALAIAAVAVLAMIAVANRRRPTTQPSALNTQPLTSTRSTRSTRLKKLPTTNYQLPTTVIFSAFWLLISLLPTLGVFGSFGMEAHADRFTYLPSMAFSFLLAGFLRCRAMRSSSPTGASPSTHNSQPSTLNPEPSTSTRSTRSTRLKKLSTTNYQLPTVIVIALLSIVTFQQLSFWRDDWAAHQRVLDCDPGHPRAMVHVADARCSRQRDLDGGIRLYRKALSLAGTVPSGGFNVADVKARLAYALASRGGYDDFAEVKRLGAEVLQDFRRDRRGMMLDALGTAFMAEGDSKRAALLFKASIDAPDRFWPKASTRRKLESCK